MEEVKRYSLTAPEKGMPMLYPDAEGVCVLYTDYAALKARVAELEHLRSMQAPDYLCEALKKERDSLRGQLEAATAWRPIETAPKDGTWVRTWGKLQGEDLAKYFGMELVRCKKYEWWNGEIYTQPTHWLPLTPAPKEA